MADALYETLELVTTEGPHKGRFPLTSGENIIGRGAEAQVLLNDPVVSRQHACIRVGEELMLEDLGSAQGTYLNGRLLIGQDFLFDNDEIRIGGTTLRLQMRRREGKTGVLIGVLCLFAAIVLCGLAMLQLEKPAASTSENTETSASVKKYISEHWMDWTTLALPSKTELEHDRFVFTPREAQGEFNFGTSVYNDRLVDLGNAYRGILHYKRALAIATLLPPESRPAIMRRSLDRIVELRELIRTSCDKRVFSYQRACRMRWWSDAYRVLHEIQAISPWTRCQYHQWAGSEIEKLDQALQKDD